MLKSYDTLEIAFEIHNLSVLMCIRVVTVRKSEILPGGRTFLATLQTNDRKFSSCM